MYCLTLYAAVMFMNIYYGKYVIIKILILRKIQFSR
jgi:hypothetical protein